MSHACRLAVLAGLALTVGVGSAWAQPVPERVRLALTLGAQVPQAGVGQSFGRPINQEPAVFSADLTTGPSVAGEGGIRVRVKGPLRAGVTLSNVLGTSGGEVEATVPHPFYFGRPRSVSGEVTGLRRQEVALHTELAWVLALGRTAELSVFGGPSYVSVRQALVTDVRYTERYPFDTADYAGVASTTATRNGIGFNAGADLTWRRWPRVGLAGQVRYARARLTLTAAPGNATTLTAGGVQAGAGVRIFY